EYVIARFSLKKSLEDGAINRRNGRHGSHEATEPLNDLIQEILMLNQESFKVRANSCELIEGARLLQNPGKGNRSEKRRGLETPGRRIEVHRRMQPQGAGVFADNAAYGLPYATHDPNRTLTVRVIF